MGTNETEVNPPIDLNDVSRIEGDDEVEAASNVQACRVAGRKDDFVPRKVQCLSVTEQPSRCAHLVVSSPAYVHRSLIVAVDEGEVRVKELAVDQRIPESIGVLKIAEKSFDRTLIAQKSCCRVVFCQSWCKGVDAAIQRDGDPYEEHGQSFHRTNRALTTLNDGTSDRC